MSEEPEQQTPPENEPPAAGALHVPDSARESYNPQSSTDQPGCAGLIIRGVAIIVIGIFVLGGLIFATCLLSMRR